MSESRLDGPIGYIGYANRDAGGVPVALLGDYLPLLTDAAVSGRRPKRRELDAVGRLGREAVERGFRPAG